MKSFFLCFVRRSRTFFLLTQYIFWCFRYPDREEEKTFNKAKILEQIDKERSQKDAEKREIDERENMLAA